MSEIRCGSSISTEADWQNAVRQCADECLAELGGSPDVAVVFLSADHGTDAQQIAGRLSEALGTERIIGCTAESLVGRSREVEFATGISLWGAQFPDAQTDVMHLEFMQTPDGGTVTGWPDHLQQEWPDDSTLLLLGDPFTFPADWLLERLNVDRPQLPVLGGMASGAASPGENRLLRGTQVKDCGAVALVLRDVKIKSIVSQGCRPVGHHMVVTAVDGNTINELGGRPAVEQLMAVYDELPTREKKMMQQGVHLGRVVTEYQDRFEQGDFLIRNVVGMDRDSGSIAIGDYLRPGQTVQFHLRDHQTATDELRLLLSRLRDDSSFQPRGGLLFTCNGRGTRLFPQPHHDAEQVEQRFGIPLAGFFAAGEIGPISGVNFLHGFTASLALF